MSFSASCGVVPCYKTLPDQSFFASCEVVPFQNEYAAIAGYTTRGISGNCVDRKFVGIPPIPQKTRNGWDTEIYSESENALKQKRINDHLCK
jgi:hypothetical protein